MDARKGPFPWFHSSGIRMCLSAEEFGNVFLKQTSEGGERRGKKEGERTGQRAFSEGPETASA